MSARRSLLGVIAVSALAACAGPRPSSIRPGADWFVVAKTVRIPEREAWIARFAEHSWFDLRRGSDGIWWRVEVLGPASGVIRTEIDEDEARDDVRWNRRVFVLATWHGDRARLAGERILELAATHPDFGRLEFSSHGEATWNAKRIPAEREEYAAWPGPNSNTFVVDIVRQIPGLALELDHNAVGKNYVRGFRAGRTLDGLGLEVDTDYLGLGFGLRQGFEFRLLGLTVGIGIWPPAIKLPIVPRIGVQPGWAAARF